MGGEQFLRFGRQRGHVDLMLLMRRSQCLLGSGQLCLQLFALSSEGAFGLLDLQVGFVLQLGCQLPDHPAQHITQCNAALRGNRLLAIQLFQVAVNRGLGAGVAQLDTYGIDAGVLAPGNQRLTRLLHYNLVYTAPGHACSYDFVPCYVPCNYIPIMEISDHPCKHFLR
ncbi:hypothetical protein D3C76_629870 [compost metagenome]